MREILEMMAEEEEDELFSMCIWNGVGENPDRTAVIRLSIA